MRILINGAEVSSVNFLHGNDHTLGLNKFLVEASDARSVVYNRVVISSLCMLETKYRGKSQEPQLLTASTLSLCYKCRRPPN